MFLQYGPQSLKHTVKAVPRVPMGFSETVRWRKAIPSHLIHFFSCDSVCDRRMSALMTVLFPGKWTFRSKAGRNHKPNRQSPQPRPGSLKSMCSYEIGLSRPSGNVGRTLRDPSPAAPVLQNWTLTASPSGWWENRPHRPRLLFNADISRPINTSSLATTGPDPALQK